jgi:hypothetical protein
MDSNQGHLSVKTAELKAILKDDSAIQPILLGRRGWGSAGNQQRAAEWYEAQRADLREFFSQKPYMLSVVTTVLGAGGTGIGIVLKVMQDLRDTGVITIGQFAQTASKFGDLLPFDSKKVQKIIEQLDEERFTFSLASNDELISSGIPDDEALARLDEREALSTIDILGILANPKVVDPLDFILQVYLASGKKEGQPVVGKRIRTASASFTMPQVQSLGRSIPSDEAEQKIGGVVYSAPKADGATELWNLPLACYIAGLADNKYYLDNGAPIGAVIATISCPTSIDSADRFTTEVMLRRISQSNSDKSFEPFHKLGINPGSQGKESRLTLLISSYTGEVGEEDIPEGLNLTEYDYGQLGDAAALLLQNSNSQAQAGGEDKTANAGSSTPTSPAYLEKAPPPPSGDAVLANQDRFETFYKLVNAAVKLNNSAAVEDLQGSPQKYRFTDRSDERWTTRDILMGLKLLVVQPPALLERLSPELPDFLVEKLKENGFEVSLSLKIGKGKGKVIGIDADEKLLTEAVNIARTSLGVSEGVTEVMKTELTIRHSFVRLWGPEALSKLPVQPAPVNGRSRFGSARLASLTANLSHIGGR